VSRTKRERTVNESSVLDNPIWFALTTAHRDMARSAGLARRYPSDISPLTGLREATPAALADLRELVAPGEGVAILTPEPLDVPGGWKVAQSRPLEQMVCEAVVGTPVEPQLRLRDADVPGMLALTAATEPGPFLPRTIEMGRYFGTRSDDDGRLIAMAGERLRLDRFTEISAVCTDPNFRGRGHARALLVYLAARNLAEGRTPFLHVVPENTGAKALYERVGFRVRRALQLTVLMVR
jgi:predicted GNAT family acetyltransferase